MNLPSLDSIRIGRIHPALVTRINLKCKTGGRHSDTYEHELKLKPLAPFVTSPRNTMSNHNLCGLLVLKMGAQWHRVLTQNHSKQTFLKHILKTTQNEREDYGGDAEAIFFFSLHLDSFVNRD